MTDKQGHRALRMIVWGSRAIGWILIALAILNGLQIRFIIPLASGFRLVSSLAQGLAGLVWIVGIELFLRFFDKYLSRN